MTLRMGDGPVANLPAGLDAYAGYVDDGGIGVTFPQVVARFPTARHLSISVHGAAAMVGDVENGALGSWSGFVGGYCAVSAVNSLVAQFGRPRRLWTAHYTDVPHICSRSCWPGLVTVADGTQWTTHGNMWDESLLSDDFFDPWAVPAPGPSERRKVMTVVQLEGTPQLYLVGDTTARYLDGVSATGFLKSLGQTEYGPITEAVLSGYHVVGRPAA